jgi:hypothetical protein
VRRTGHFDVIAITDHILMKRDSARVGRLLRSATVSFLSRGLLRRLPDDFEEAVRAKLSLQHAGDSGAEITQNHIRSKNSHIIALT